MQEHKPLLAILIETDRLHETMTGGRTISRSLRIDVLRVQASWTVIPARAMCERDDSETTMLAGEGFLTRQKKHGLHIEPKMEDVSIPHDVFLPLRPHFPLLLRFVL